MEHVFFDDSALVVREHIFDKWNCVYCQLSTFLNGQHFAATPGEMWTYSVDIAILLKIDSS